MVTLVKPALAATRTPSTDATLISTRMRSCHSDLCAKVCTQPRSTCRPHPRRDATHTQIRGGGLIPLRVPGRWLAEHGLEVADEVALVGVAEVRRQRGPVD